MNESTDNIEVSKMKDLSISDALRYLVVGMELLILFYFFRRDDFNILATAEYSSILLPLIAFALGTVFYSIYKVTIHTWVIRPLHDLHITKSYRNYIIRNFEHIKPLNNGYVRVLKWLGMFKGDYKSISHWNAERFWYYLSNLEFENRNKYLDNQSSMHHLVYQTGLIFILIGLFPGVSRANGYFFQIGVILLIFGWFYAGFIEKYILDLIMTLEKVTKNNSEKNIKNLDYYAKKFGFKRIKEKTKQIKPHRKDMSNEMRTISKRETLILLGIISVSMVISGIGPYDRVTWYLEVAPVFIGIPLLFITFKRFPLTPLTYRLLTIHALILILGGHYTYARVPLGYWIQELFDFSRNHYDRIGHLAQGFVPAILAREILLRTSPLNPGKWLFVIVTSIALAFSAFYEMIEWWASIAGGDSAESFLGSQGDIWDTQWDMFLALLGAMSAQLVLSKRHDRELNR